jgi:hypothetical protein
VEQRPEHALVEHELVVQAQERRQRGSPEQERARRAGDREPVNRHSPAVIAHNRIAEAEIAL